ncbi:hypothetical protein CBR_g22834 [Chara braunii]|uniref:Uncharacterized protein n=1 Tax=Chara braunii TaxID=69332 RepID=A0A388L2Z4_CHABU|nr:hypothetical protein CBR_g22834 [Chara braunii]|eukprot:GBG76618.1 hypothetical protein CBR_g22834 [Chara braunii]
MNIRCNDRIVGIQLPPNIQCKGGAIVDDLTVACANEPSSLNELRFSEASINWEKSVYLLLPICSLCGLFTLRRLN